MKRKVVRPGDISCWYCLADPGQPCRTKWRRPLDFKTFRSRELPYYHETRHRWADAKTMVGWMLDDDREGPSDAA